MRINMRMLRTKKCPGLFLHHSHKFVVSHRSKGVSIIEVIIGSALLLFAVTGLLTAYSMFIKVGMNTLNNIQATYLLEEGIEVASILRDYGWTSNISGLNSSTKYYFYWDGTGWTATTTVAKIDSLYTRYAIFGGVNRDSNDNIASSGTLDSGTKKVTVVVSWQNGATTTSRTLSSYVTNLFSN